MLAVELLYSVLLIALSKTVLCSYRKIKDGKRVDESVQYMVYLTKAEQSETHYDAWICGGAIVSHTFIVTSAACVEDVQYMYAISGYSKYVNGDYIDSNECTSASKKKIVFICVPRRYDFAYHDVTKWAFIDIAAVQVESPYIFSAPILPGCSWTPNKIEINYDATYQGPDIDAIVMGWGHAKKWRKPGDPTDYNQEDLQYSSIRIMNKAECKKLYEKTPELYPIIDKYMICAMHEGNLNDKGRQIKKPSIKQVENIETGYSQTRKPKKLHKENNRGKSSLLRSETVSQYEIKDKTSSVMNNQPNPTNKNPITPKPLRLQNNKGKSLPLKSKTDSQYEMKVKTSLDMNNRPNPTDHNPITLKPLRLQNQQTNTRNQHQQNISTTNITFQTNPYANKTRQNNSTNYNKVTNNPLTYQNLQNIQTNDNPLRAKPFEYNDDDVISFEDIIMNVRRSNKNETNKLRYTRKAGICQNDHGGPLVTWIGSRVRLIGVASVFRLDNSYSCVGPYLFTSTQCNGAFLDCIIREYEKVTVDPKPLEALFSEITTPIIFETSTTEATTQSTIPTTIRMNILHNVTIIQTGDDFGRRKSQRQAFCNQPPALRGFDVVKRRISWKYHPHGPAHNELADY